MQVEITCGRCPNFNQRAEMPDHNLSIASELGEDPGVPGATITSLGIMEHHRSTRPTGAGGGHDIFEIKVIANGNRFKLVKEGSWVLQKD